jgi:hypothetical protein
MVESILDRPLSDLTPLLVQGSIAYTYSILDRYSLVYTSAVSYKESSAVYSHLSVNMAPFGKMIFKIKDRPSVNEFVHSISTDDFVIHYYPEYIVLIKQSFSEYLTEEIYNYFS